MNIYNYDDEEGEEDAYLIPIDILLFEVEFWDEIIFPAFGDDEVGINYWFEGKDWVIRALDIHVV